MKQVELYTDGSSKGNPGPGGYGLILKYGRSEKELKEGFFYTTNNRMELLAVIVGLETLNKTGMNIMVYSDSKYVVDSVIKKWVFKWEKKQFAKKKNPDLWKRFLNVYRKHNVDFTWLKGHSEHPYNERCDKLAVSAAESPTLHDTFYENESKTSPPRLF